LRAIAGTERFALGSAWDVERLRTPRMSRFAGL
jgi:hypothetical protein